MTVQSDKRRFGWSAALLAALAAGALLAAMPGCPPPRVVEAPFRTKGVPGVRVLIAAGQKFEAATTAGYRMLVDHQAVASSMAPLGTVEIRRQGDAWQVNQAAYRAASITIEAVGRSCVRLGTVSYRGSVVFHTDPAGDGILAVNHVDVESYLAGVLPRELYPSWHPTTYRAGAIAARTYALYEAATVGQGRPFDLRDDQSSQVYGGYSAETDKAWEAVRMTHGVVLAAGPPGREKIFRAHYSSCCGGMTNNVYVLYGPKDLTGPLRGGYECRDCQASTRYRWPAVTVPKAVIHRALARVYPAAAAMTQVTGLEVIERLGDRPVWLDACGPGAQKVRIRADDLRLALLRDGDPASRGLCSMNCQVRDAGPAVVFEGGRGFGHGVGLCQWGAEGMAQRGLSPEKILTSYFPDSRLFRAY